MISKEIKKTMYFVGESKTSKDQMDLRGSEFHKIQYGKKHFDVISGDDKNTQYKHLAHPREIWEFKIDQWVIYATRSQYFQTSQK